MQAGRTNPRDRISETRLRRNNIRCPLAGADHELGIGNEWANNYNFAMRANRHDQRIMRLWTLSKLRFYRPKTYRYHEEQEAIEGWLDTVGRRLPCTISWLSKLPNWPTRKGYSDTHKRGLHLTRIMRKSASPAQPPRKIPIGVRMLSLNCVLPL